MPKHIGYWNFILLAVLGGSFGIQEFYVKRYVAGVFAVLFMWTAIPAIVACVEAIVWLFKGEKAFNEKFNGFSITDKMTLLDE